MHLLIQHPQYSHISPNATGILAEFPIWYVLDRFAHLPPGTQAADDVTTLPVDGPAIPLTADTVRAPLSIGESTTEKRPTSKVVRYAAF